MINNYILLIPLTLISIILSIQFLPIINKISKKKYNQPQKIHKKITSRFGGLSIFISLLLFYIFFYEKSQGNDLFYLFLISSMPLLVIALTEDIHIEIMVIYRFLIMILSSIIFLYFSNYYFPIYQFPLIGKLMNDSFTLENNYIYFIIFIFNEWL